MTDRVTQNNLQCRKCEIRVENFTQIHKINAIVQYETVLDRIPLNHKLIARPI